MLFIAFETFKSEKQSSKRDRRNHLQIQHDQGGLTRGNGYGSLDLRKLGQGLG